MTEDKSKDLAIIFIWNVLPTIVFHSIIGEFWTSNRGADQTYLTLFETLFTMVILPPSLLIANRFLKKKYNVTSRLAIFIIMALTIGISSLLHFKNWADSVGSWNNPDVETIAVVQFEFIIGLIFILMPTIIGRFHDRSIRGY